MRVSKHNLFISLTKSDVGAINFGGSLGRVVKGAHNVFISVDEELLLALKDDLAASVLWQKYSVANFNVHGTDRTILENFAGSNCDYFTVSEMFVFLAGGKDDSALSLGEGLGLLDDYTIEEGFEGLECEH